MKISEQRYTQGFARGANLTVEQAADQICAMHYQVANWDNEDDGVRDGEEFARLFPVDKS